MQPGEALIAQHQHVNFNERREVRFWCATFGVTYEQLRYVVEAVGTSVAKIGEYLAPSTAKR